MRRRRGSGFRAHHGGRLRPPSHRSPRKDGSVRRCCYRYGVPCASRNVVSLSQTRNLLTGSFFSSTPQLSAQLVRSLAASSLSEMNLTFVSLLLTERAHRTLDLPREWRCLPPSVVFTLLTPLVFRPKSGPSTHERKETLWESSDGRSVTDGAPSWSPSCSTRLRRSVPVFLPSVVFALPQVC
jgi:hypothetical protein